MSNLGLCSLSTLSSMSSRKYRRATTIYCRQHLLRKQLPEHPTLHASLCSPSTEPPPPGISATSTEYNKSSHLSFVHPSHSRTPQRQKAWHQSDIASWSLGTTRLKWVPQFDSSSSISVSVSASKPFPPPSSPLFARRPLLHRSHR